MSGDADRGAWRATTDHGRIVDWAEERDAVPVRVSRTGEKPGLRITTDLDVERGERISWGRFFERFDEEGLVFRYRETGPAEAGERACEIVGREEMTGQDFTTGAEESAGEREVEQIGGSDTGEGEPIVYDRVESDTGDATDPGTSMSESARGVETKALVLDEIYEDPDLRSDPDDEYLVFENTGENPIDLSGWTVTNDAGRSYTFPEGFSLGRGERVTLHSGEGTDTETDLYWGSEDAVWDTTGDVVTVTAPDGERVLREPYET